MKNTKRKTKMVKRRTSSTKRTSSFSKKKTKTRMNYNSVLLRFSESSSRPINCMLRIQFKSSWLISSQALRSTLPSRNKSSFSSSSTIWQSILVPNSSAQLTLRFARKSAPIPILILCHQTSFRLWHWYDRTAWWKCIRHRQRRMPRQSQERHRVPNGCYH